MSTYHVTPDTQSDLIKIRRFTVQQWGLAQSQKYLSELRKTISLLAETPSLGKSKPEVGANVLSFPHVSHVIYYVVHKRQLLVFGVLHKSMVPLDHLVKREMI
ncbi:type II toxin-antitoxin system RelE/ParE family toxin [Xenorhabdus bovienii]|uniref:type II toxin-antitoxin system RelE/ParE family toxin n=1 Tax=Xenorhabdus bovienii TaxID=40576 RepID=UPI001EE14BD4|nr:type II toxin-antitoxin system RelE/ParE family toxin [Xenorhabdus bovienii]MCG3461094.1 type II toxin-antitoxin system RelE/ParE family toxin [Xenorhabdus bovienii]